MDLKSTIKRILDEQVDILTNPGVVDPELRITPTKPKSDNTTPKSDNTTSDSKKTEKIDVGYVDIPQILIDAYGIELVKSVYESQGFEVTDDNKVTGWGLPLPKQFMKAPSGNQKFGSPRGNNVHDACDYSADEGTPIYATKSGNVNYIETKEQNLKCGNGIGIGKNNFSTIYCHMKNKPSLSIGEEVSIGQKIGEVGSTGHSDGPHLHIKTKSKSGPFDNWAEIYSQLV